MKDKDARAEIQELKQKIFGGGPDGFAMSEPVPHTVSITAMVSNLIDRVIKLENQCMRPEIKQKEGE